LSGALCPHSCLLGSAPGKRRLSPDSGSRSPEASISEVFTGASSSSRGRRREGEDGALEGEGEEAEEERRWRSERGGVRLRRGRGEGGKRGGEKSDKGIEGRGLAFNL
jgi:hypothetical protein